MALLNIVIDEPQRGEGYGKEICESLKHEAWVYNDVFVLVSGGEGGCKMIAKNNFLTCAANAKNLYEYAQIGTFNDHMMTVVAVADRTLDFHVHEDSDEMFVILEGRMGLEFKDGIVDLGVGDFIIVPKGTYHRPVCTELVKCLLVERKGTLNDENSGGTYTKGEKVNGD